MIAWLESMDRVRRKPSRPMANLSEAALGAEPALAEELSQLGEAVGKQLEEAKIQEARRVLAEAAGNDHALLDASGIIAFFCTITKIVDFSGHYSDRLTKMLAGVSSVLVGARRVRQTVCCSSK